jgi:dienelactone hydrolase
MRTVLPSGTSVELVSATNPTRGIVLLPDIGGLRPLFDDLAQRLADEHRWAIAVPEPFPGQEHLGVDQRIAEMANFDARRQLDDCRAAAEMLDEFRVGVIGFCMGGTGTMRAAIDPRFDRLVAFYGMPQLPDAWKGPGVTDPVDDVRSAPGAAARLLVLCGTADPFVPVSSLDAIEATGTTVVRYPDAGHAFAHDVTAAWFREADAADAWRRAAAWLA